MAQVFKKINKKNFLTFFDDFFRDLNRKSNFSQNISIFRGSRYHFWNRLIKSNKKKKRKSPCDYGLSSGEPYLINILELFSFFIRLKR